ncbi:FK506-binding protein 15-like [Aedes aegypti]|uniref:Uncharacterized protein n=1 Tax=Aedes aegypti TaxID=7159 RepID=A0A6R8GXD8_AEDAE|nr:FK506-binding protein 15 [Aedes aegypti]XP_021712665.1 FK506-binding protein 15-like [Aedes aegypti]
MPTTNKAGPVSDDDDDFFKPTSNSTLAKIFGVPKGGAAVNKKSSPEKDSRSIQSTPSSKVSDRYGASSFRYVPPSEAVDSTTDGEQPGSKPSSDWNLVQASVVTAYKLVGNENTPQGKLGLALLRSQAEFRILIYRTKTDALATLNLDAATKLFLKNEYLQFRSDDDDFWSVLFENPVDRDRLLAAIEGVCLLELERQPHKQRVPPIPASRTIPNVEEPDSDAEKGKANLISRMARVGQPILPQAKPVSTTEVSDSSDTDARFETIARPSIPPHRRPGNGGVGKIQPVTMGMQIIPSAANALTTAIAGQNLLHTATDVNFNLFMTESRMQGTEVRMNLSKLESKLDRVLDKIDLMNLNSTGEAKSNTDKDDDILALEEKILELKKDNHALKGKVRSLEAEVSTRNEDVHLKQQLAESEKRYSDLQLTVAAIQKDLTSSRDKSEVDLREMERIRLEQDATKQSLHEKAKEIELLTEQLKDAHNSQSSLREENSKLVKQNEDLQSTLNNMEQQLKSLNEKVTGSEPVDELIKTIMNNCFQRMCDQIDDARTLKIVGQTIKHETKAALARRQKK